MDVKGKTNEQIKQDFIIWVEKGEKIKIIGFIVAVTFLICNYNYFMKGYLSRTTFMGSILYISFVYSMISDRRLSSLRQIIPIRIAFGPQPIEEKYERYLTVKPNQLQAYAKLARYTPEKYQKLVNLLKKQGVKLY